MGTGDNDFMGYLQDLQKRYPERVATNLSFGAELRKLVLAGSDVMLVPSIFEPCGLVQMEAMRYGCVPIVRRVGGLADSVADYDPVGDKGTGFVFNNYDRYAFLIAIIRAYETFRNRKEWKELVKRAMTADLSWRRSAQDYLKLFENAIALHREHQVK